MSKRYEVFRKGNDPGKDIAKYDVAIAELASRLPDGSAYEYKKRGGDEWITVKSKPILKKKLADRSLKVGEAFLARRKGGRATFCLRAIEVLKAAPSYPDRSGTSGVKACWDEAWEAFRKLGDGYEFVFMGAFVCRRIDGSLTWSNHAFHNAFDFRIRRANAPNDSIDQAATSKVANALKGKAAEVIWLAPGHTYHCHITGPPKRYGTPACA